MALRRGARCAAGRVAGGGRSRGGRGRFRPRGYRPRWLRGEQVHVAALSTVVGRHGTHDLSPSNSQYFRSTLWNLSVCEGRPCRVPGRRNTQGRMRRGTARKRVREQLCRGRASGRGQQPGTVRLTGRDPAPRPYAKTACQDPSAETACRDRAPRPRAGTALRDETRLREAAGGEACGGRGDPVGGASSRAGSASGRPGQQPPRRSDR